jgi:integrase
MAKVPYLQFWKGSFRVRMGVPAELRSKLGKRELTRPLGTSNKCEAFRSPLYGTTVAEFHAEIARVRAQMAPDNREPGWRMAHQWPATPWSPVSYRSEPPPKNAGRWVWQEATPEAPGAAAVTFASMIEKWAKETKAPHKGVQDMGTKTLRFATECLDHTGIVKVRIGDHDYDLSTADMAPVTKRDCVAYKFSMIEEDELSHKSISNHIKALKSIFAYTSSNNDDISDPIASVKFSAESDGRDDFTAEERCKILTMARSASPAIYWLNWLGSFTGARLSELADAHTDHIRQIDGVWCFEFTKKLRTGDKKNLKTKQSTRVVPLHSALLAEGFLDYVNSLDQGSLFPMLSLDKGGSRVASSLISEWLRNTVGITDPRKPWYSHRHTMISYLRNSPNVKEEIELYLRAHRKTVHMSYGRFGIPALKAAIEEIPNPLVGLRFRIW